MNKSNTITNIFLYGFVGVAILDALFAILVRIKHPVFNESNPIYLLTGSFALALLYKAVIVFFVYKYFTKWYYKSSKMLRFAMTTMLLFAIIGQGIGAYSGFVVLGQEVSEVQPISKEARLENYQQTFKINYQGFLLYGFMLLCFWLYLHFEERDILLEEKMAKTKPKKGKIHGDPTVEVQ